MDGHHPGALVISLDFELHWGMRDKRAADGPYGPAFTGARTAVLRLLQLFRGYDVAATWATVGFLFARNRQELESRSPAVRPAYVDPGLNPYPECIGEDELTDPVHFAPSLIQRVRLTPRQELGTHTYSHFYCGEPGATPRAFAADLSAAREIAAAQGISFRSIVFPRNQVTRACLGLLPPAGIDVYRGTPPGRLWRRGRNRFTTAAQRLGRLADSYLPGPDDTVGWHEIGGRYGLWNVRASRFLRPYHPGTAGLEPLRLHRITDSLRRASRQGRIYHLWWHPHNFGTHTDENLDLLTRILDVYMEEHRCRGMQSMSMGGVADYARSAATTRSGA